jgi:luciferase family oxidoreductase group 1
MKKNINFSVLDLGSVIEGQEISDALDEIVNRARLIETLGFKRIWLAEHHNMPGASTAATAVLIGHVAGKTTTLRVGAAGIMLPNHTPLAIAEQFGTLDILYPNRIDLGLGRAPGTDQATAAALRRNNIATQNQFPEDVRELQRYLSTENSEAKVRAFPGEGREVPIWILGSSTDSAYLAAELGLPYAFASHFAPAQLFAAAEIYKQNFKPSEKHSEPYFMVGANVIVADNEEEAAYLKTSLQQMILGFLGGGRPGKLPAPVRELPPVFSRPDVQQALYNFTACTFTGDQNSVKAKVENFIMQTGADELFITNYIYDKAAREKSFTLFAEAMGLRTKQT